MWELITMERLGMSLFRNSVIKLTLTHNNIPYKFSIKWFIFTIKLHFKS